MNGKSILVTGGSRGFGRAMVAALAAQGAAVTALARDAGPLAQLAGEVKGVQTCAADVSDPQLAPRLLRELQPDILILNAGTMPSQLPIRQQSWEQLGCTWETDVKRH